jgi:hypothetical protein
MRVSGKRGSSVKYRYLFCLSLVIVASELPAASASDERLRPSPILVGKIELSAMKVSSGGTITISSRLSTTRTVLRGVSASFYDGDPSKGGRVFAVDRVARLETGHNYPISATYLAKSCGTHQLFIVVSQRNSDEIIRRAPPLEVSCLGLPSPSPTVTTCSGGALAPGSGEDLEVTAMCTVGAGTYQYHNVNVYNGGTLAFADAKIDFWAESILIENQSSLIAGSPTQPIGSQGGLLTIHLYGADQGTNGSGIECKTDLHCGVDPSLWNSNGGQKFALPSGVNDYFYAYMPLDYDGGDLNAFFGYKVLGVSYGATLQLYGLKGAKFGNVLPSDSGMSWGRLNGSVKTGDTALNLDRAVNWQPGDQIAITSTDYVPSHSEQLEIASITPNTSGTAITLKNPVQYPHYGQTFSLDKVPAGIGPDPDPLAPSGQPRNVETRAAVALLTRSIRIVSEGDQLMKSFSDQASNYYFGGHTVIRQGFQQVQMQGVEFYQMGQGGRIMHYPVHFHMARKTPSDTLVADCSVHDSMTRWYTLHSTQGVTLARNVGYLSIGHGYYLEDGTETDNKFYSNIGIHARAAVENAKVNPRNVPGIFAKPFTQLEDAVPFHSDVDHPTIFWITNAYNDFEYNMASGADTCGACYWLVPASISGMSRMQKWESYASEQAGSGRFGTTPLYKFVGNYCSTAMTSFNTIGNTNPCLGVANTDTVPGSQFPRLNTIENPLLQNVDEDNYYPKVDTGGGRFPTLCPADGSDCSQVPICTSGQQQNCAVTILDRYTTAFNFTETNFAAIWLRPQWYLVINSAISDIQNGGLTFVTGGGYTDSDVVPGHWALAKKSVFIGNSQTPSDTDPFVNPYASNGGPFNPATPLRCATPVNSTASVGDYCLSADDNLSMPLSTFGVNQRLFSIYDGPSYQESNAYLNISKTDLTDCQAQTNPGPCQSNWMYGQLVSIPKDSQGKCYLPNAAIAWKQPNGFFYPPAFHSNNLFFDSVDIRHFVIEPQFLPGTFKTDPEAVAKRYCTWNSAMFDNFTDIDRQTELNDDDGSLTGLVGTISVNQDPFFDAPVETPECGSDIAGQVPPGTAKTSPYDYVTTVEYPGCGTQCGANWSVACSDPTCYGVPIYNEFHNPGATGLSSVRMAGQSVAQRSTLTVNHASYYIDTTVPLATQQQPGIIGYNVFQPGQTYYTFLLFAKPTTQQTYQLYVGPGFNPDTDVWMSQASVGTVPFQFQQENWPSTWMKSYDASTGVLTVTMDMSFPDFKAQYDAVAQQHCQPQSFCSWKPATNSCASSLPSTDPLANDSQSICSKWPVKDVDCPASGCFGFGVKLPAGFATGSKPNLPPTARCFPQNPDWNVPFVPASETVAGKSCFYSTVPTGNFCQDPQSVPNLRRR